MDTVEMKAALRRSTQVRLDSLSTSEIRQRSQWVQENLLNSRLYQQAQRIGIYLSMPNGEAGTENIVEHALGHGKQVFVPYLYKNPGSIRIDNGATYKPKRIMNMVSLHSIDDYHSLEADKWGIPSVPDSSISDRKHVLGELVGDPPRRADVETLDVIFMPGVAFDRHGGRLGHGRGFYDFFLEEYRIACAMSSDAKQAQKGPTLVALALPEQVLPPGEEIPIENHDRRIDAIVTADEMIVM